VSVRVTGARVVNSHSRVAKVLSDGARTIDSLTINWVRRGRMPIELARRLREITQAMQVAAQLLPKARPRTRAASDRNRRKGRDTSAWVLRRAQELKRKNPRLSRKAAAELIGADHRAPCAFERAHGILKARYNRVTWAALKGG
jgi:hypothetical protein